MKKKEKKQATPLKTAETKETKKGESLYIPFWLIQKAKSENVTTDQLLVYSWLFYKNRAGKIIYGKRTFDVLATEIKISLNIQSADDLCRALESKGWIEKARAEPFNGHEMKGYRCLLTLEAKADSRAEHQAMSMTDEEAVVEMESSVPTHGEYMYGGVRFYDDEDGNPQQVPSSAPPRPTDTAVWVEDPEGWYEPDEIPEHESEF